MAVDPPDPRIAATLALLDGWVIDDGEVDPDADPDAAPTDDGEVHTVTTDEITKFIAKAMVRAAAYISLTDPSKLPANDLVNEAVATWAAGLLWNKYVVKVNEGKEQDDPNTYGDKKIWEAKGMLKPYNEDKDDDGKPDIPILTSTYVSD